MILFSFFATSAFSAQWAVLMAGSRGYNNYRHQADVFNLYQILIQRGFDKQHIILLAYNDVVEHELNPHKGEVYSRPDHVNVHPGNESIDYQGKMTTAENFLRVLNGDNRKGRALETNENDDIFIYYNDHGAPGLLCVPSNNGPELYTDHLQKTLDEMRKNKKFHRIFFVIEACYSGSIAKSISVPNVFFLVAAGPTQSSYSSDWDSEIDAFRTNEFTKHFVSFALENPSARIIDSVNNATQSTIRSHVCAYGDFKVSKLPLSTFLLNAAPVYIRDDDMSSNSNPADSDSNGEYSKKAFISFLKRRVQKTNAGPQRDALENLLEKEILRRKRSSKTFKAIAEKFTEASNGGRQLHLFENPVEEIKFQCYRTAVEGFRLFCGEVDEHEMPKLRVFSNLCEFANTTQLLAEIHEVCPQRLWEENELFV